jgi:hypothetical protein
LKASIWLWTFESGMAPDPLAFLMMWKTTGIEKYGVLAVTK